MEIDLHDLSVNEAIRIFIEKYNKAFKNGYKGKISVIHGYGSSGQGGKIKRAFKTFSEEHKKFLKVEYTINPGITDVYPLKAIPQILDLLSKELLEYCSKNPKSLSKIESEFFKKYTAKEIKICVKSLVNKGLLEEILKKDIVYLKKE